MIIILILIIINTITLADPLLNYPNQPDSNEIDILKQKLQNYDDTTKKIISEFKISNTNYTEINNAIKKLFPNSNIIHNTPKNSLIIKHNKNEYKKIKKLITSLDVPQKEIFLECKIYELSINSRQEFDLFNDISQHPILLTNKNSFKITNANSLLETIKLLETTGKAILIAQPSIKLTHNFKSNIKIGDKIPYITTSHTTTNSYQQINTFKTGITLSVLPTLTNSNIKCNINLNLTHIKYWKTINKQELPVIAERELSTSCTFKEKTTTLIGNYINYSKTSNINQSPLLSKVPILNKLFRYKHNQKNKTILLIFITPYI
jgi:general secretion pathway protein D